MLTPLLGDSKNKGNSPKGKRQDLLLKVVCNPCFRTLSVFAGALHPKEGGLLCVAMQNLVPTIGLEIHAELKTQTKMFCDSANEPHVASPNTNVCPVCLAHPGTLPVINKTAVRHVLTVGLAVDGTLADYTEFDRKNYFYPDIPKGYQISQYAYPLVSGGVLSGVPLTRIHLEEDTARSQHDPKIGATLVDFNRAGVPLMELVTEPEIHSAVQASDFAKELQLLLRYLGAGDANMEKGEMRVEANISVAPEGERGTKVEIKNLNSFRSVEKAIEFEIKRQKSVLEKGEKVTQETRGWDEAKQETFAQRVKEGSADYRYFPDPDLPKLIRSTVPEFQEDTLRGSMPELPKERTERYVRWGIKTEDARMLVREKMLGDFLDEVIGEHFNESEFVTLSVNYLLSDLVKNLKERSVSLDEASQTIPLSPENFSALVAMILAGKLSSRGAKDTLGVMMKEGGSPEVVAETNGWIQKDNAEELRPLVLKVLAEHRGVVDEVRAGKDKSLQFLVGQTMKAGKGANPKVVLSLIQEIIASGS